MQDLQKRLTEALCWERRSKTQNSHQACPRRILQQAVIERALGSDIIIIMLGGRESFDVVNTETGNQAHTETAGSSK